MTYTEAVHLIDFLNHRMRPLRWYQWAVDVNWHKLQRWAELLGYRVEAKP